MNNIDREAIPIQTKLELPLIHVDQLGELLGPSGGKLGLVACSLKSDSEPWNLWADFSPFQVPTSFVGCSNLEISSPRPFRPNP
ncbi:unnamed protein product [Citrullus colocynthis]|uniref:Uncharacterized protein n=1 Tax=Citrullus colocynthis TaxID=252529 RepID=A0ABP0YEV1_9ROSI